jgi:hypothetical protein
MTQYSTPKELAERWRTSAESIIALIRAGRLRAFTLSPPGSPKPRWKISPDAIAEYEARHAARPPAKAPARRRRDPAVIEFY